MIIVTLYRRSNCEACEKVLTDLEALQTVVPHKVIQIDVESDNVLDKAYQGELPVVHIGPYRLRRKISRKDLQVALSAANDRLVQLEGQEGQKYQRQLERGRSYSGSDKLSSWMSKHYMALFNLVLAGYVGLAILAPIFMKVGATGPAKIIYMVYRPLCHQLSFRSFFLFGEQAYYPRELAGVSGAQTYEAVSGSETINLREAQNVVGDEHLGYKVALCERCLAIYGSMMVFGIIFSLSGRKLKSLPWFLWLVIGLGPIGLDGVSQLPSLVGRFFDWLIIRESTPFLRVLTGSLFGITTAWYLYPFIEESMQESRVILAKKLAVSREFDLASTEEGQVDDI